MLEAIPLDQLLFYIVVILLALGGLSIAVYIWRHKRQSSALVCPIGTSCDPVIHSEYSRFFGIPVELIGMAYYALVAAGYALFIIQPELAHSFVIFFFLAVTTAAVLFSVYLTAIQAFALRMWCTWCLFSAGICATIFAFVLAGAELGFIEILAQYEAVITGIGLFALALGVGGATIADVMFLKFLKDRRISGAESGVLHSILQIVWFGLAVLVLSGVARYLIAPQELGQSPLFLAMTAVLAVIAVNGVLLHFTIIPELKNVSFGARDENDPHHAHIRSFSFAAGAISLVSWYAVLMLALIPAAPISFSGLMLIYASTLVLAVAASQVIDRSVSTKQHMHGG